MAKDKKKSKEEKTEKKSKGTTYNLADFAKPIAEATEMNSGDVRKVLVTFCDTLNGHITGDGLEPGDKVNLPGLGHFVCQMKKPRNARNPKTGEKLLIPSRKAVKFKLAAAIRLYGKVAPKKSKK